MARLPERMAAGEDGATTVEYAIVLSLVGAAPVATITAPSSPIGTRFTPVSNTVGGPWGR
jgi:Flp pilus assembly pilin Flp